MEKLQLILLTTLFSIGIVRSQGLTTIAVYPFDAEGVSKVAVESFRERVEATLLASRKFTVVTRSEIDKAIKELGIVQCFTEECVIQVGKFIGAHIIVTGRIAGFGGQSYSVNTKLLKTETAQIVASFSQVYEGTELKLVKEYSVVVADGLVEQLLWAVLSLDGYPGAIVKLDEKIIGRLPIPIHPVKPGRHLIKVEQEGFEKWKHQHYFTEEEEYSRFVELIPKTKKSALIKSLVIPGWGQLYSSDDHRFGKILLGYSLLITEAALIGESYIVYKDYLNKKINYDNAHSNYVKIASDTSAITTARKVMLNEYGSMEDAFDLFQTLAFLSVAVWFGNALEAYLNFPEYADVNLGYYNRDHRSFAENSKRGVRVEVSVAF